MLSQDQIDALEAQYPDCIRVVDTRQRWECVFRKPTRAQYKMFRGNANNPARAADAQEILARQIVVYPAPADFDALLDKYPGIPEACGQPFLTLVGASGDEQGK